MVKCFFQDKAKRSELALWSFLRKLGIMRSLHSTSKKAAPKILETAFFAFFQELEVYLFIPLLVPLHPVIGISFSVKILRG